MTSRPVGQEGHYFLENKFVVLQLDLTINLMTLEQRLSIFLAGTVFP